MAGGCQITTARKSYRKKIMRALSLLVLVAGCQSGWDCPKVHFTPAGIPVSVRPDVTEADVATIDMWIDLRLEEWVRNKAAWGCDTFSDSYLRFSATKEPVIVFPGKLLENPPSAMGFNYWKDGHDGSSFTRQFERLGDDRREHEWRLHLLHVQLSGQWGHRNRCLDRQSK